MDEETRNEIHTAIARIESGEPELVLMIPEDKVSSLDICIFEARHPSVEFRMTEGQGFPPFMRLQLRPARHGA